MADERNLEHAASRLGPLLRGAVAEALREAAGGVPCHLVGGALRDLLLGLGPSRDLDAVVARDGRSIAERFAGRTGSRFVDLGRERFASFRCVGEEFTLDLWDRQGTPLVADLERRDFTVNALALDLHGGGLTDPFGGLDDLAQRRLRAVSQESFAGDPLRVLRLVRLAAQLGDKTSGFRVEPATVDLARRAVPGLDEVAPERVRTELELIFAGPGIERAVDLLIRLDLYPALWSGAAGPADAFLAALPRLERLTHRFRHRTGGAPPQVDPFLGRMALATDCLPGDGPARRDALDRFAARGYLARRAGTRVAALLAAPPLPTAEPAARWFLHTQGDRWPTTLCLRGARSEAPDTSWDRTLDLLLDLVHRATDEIFDPPPLIDGEAVQALLGLPPGPAVGIALAAVRRRQIEGTLRTRQAAERFLAESHKP